jgi:hypothetical protein
MFQNMRVDRILIISSIALAGAVVALFVVLAGRGPEPRRPVVPHVGNDVQGNEGSLVAATESRVDGSVAAVPERVQESHDRSTRSKSVSVLPSALDSQELSSLAASFTDALPMDVMLHARCLEKLLDAGIDPRSFKRSDSGALSARGRDPTFLLAFGPDSGSLGLTIDLGDDTSPTAPGGRIVWSTGSVRPGDQPSFMEGHLEPRKGENYSPEAEDRILAQSSPLHPPGLKLSRVHRRGETWQAETIGLDLVSMETIASQLEPVDADAQAEPLPEYFYDERGVIHSEELGQQEVERFFEIYDRARRELERLAREREGGESGGR